MSNRKRVGTLELAAVLFVAVMAAAFLATQMGGCGMVAGLGRSITAMADGDATETAKASAAIDAAR